MLFGNGKSLGLLGLLSVVIVTLVLTICDVTHVHRDERSTQTDECISTYSGIEIDYVLGSSPHMSVLTSPPTDARLTTLGHPNLLQL